jgi:phytoene desaturase
MKKIIIIGSGFGGLSLAIRLQAQGFQVTIFEKNSRVGGHAYQLQEKGYTFDLGPSLITAPEIIDRLFQTAGKKVTDYVDLIPLNPFYRIYFHDGSFIDYQGDTDEMKRQMGAFNPRDAAQYDKFMLYAQQVYQKVIHEGLGTQPFYWSTLLKFLPAALKLKVPIPSYYVIKNYFKDPRNIFTFSFNTLFIGGNPFRSPSVYLMIPYLEKTGGVWYTKGGMYRFVAALEKVFLELGGEIQPNAEVTEIVVQNGKAVGVKVHDTLYSADAVVSNAHFAHTHLDLIAAENRHKWHNRKVKNMAYSMSAFVIYLGLRRRYPQLRHHTLIISKDYKKLVGDIFDRKILSDDFSIYCHAPTRTDDSMAPPGCESLYALIPVPNLAGKIDWNEMAEPFTQKVLNFLEQNFGLEHLKENIEVMKRFTPLDFETHCNNYLGSAWGLEPKLTQTATFRPCNRSEDIKNFYLVGASTHPGAGVPGVMLTAEATENAIRADLK